MKAKAFDTIKISLDIRSDFDRPDKIIPKGTEGTVVECYEEPEGYAVDLAIPNENLVGGCEYENLILAPDQFQVVAPVSENFGVGTA